MRAEPLTAPADQSADPFPSTPSVREAGSSRIAAAVAHVRAELTNCLDAGRAAAAPALQAARRGLAREIVAVARPNRGDAWVAETQGLVETLVRLGGHEAPVDAVTLGTARGWLTRGWSGALAAMLVAPSWQLPEAPVLDDQPDWLWRTYAAWLFHPPTRFSGFSADALAQHQARHLRVLERWSARNAGSASLRAAVAAYLAGTRLLAADASPVAWREAAELRGRMLTRCRGRGPAGVPLPATPRHGRRLRVGFVAMDFGPGPVTHATLPCFEELDARSFEVFLFPLRPCEAPEAGFCSRRARETHVLPAGLAERLEFLRRGQLDVLVFAGDPGRDDSEVTELALHRIAPLQVVNHRTGLTTGLPEIDLCVAGFEPTEARPASAFTERLGLLRGPAHSISLARPGTEAAATAGRSEIGLPVEGTLLVAVVDASGVPEPLLRSWATVLARLPEAHLAIALVHDGSDGPVALFCAAVDAALSGAQVESRRVTIFPASLTRPHEVRALVALGDLSLDAGATDLAAWIAAEALHAGVPVIPAPGRTESAPVDFLRSLGLEDWVPATGADAERLAVALAADETARGRVRHAMETEAAFFDSLAASDAFGALIEAAFDELCSLGHAEFRKQAEPVRCFGIDDVAETIASGLAAHAAGDYETAALEAGLALRSAPADPQARYLAGVVLNAQGCHSRAVDYLLGAVQRPGATAETWHALARALRDNQQPAEAIQALEACLRLDGQNVEALVMLLELSEAVGATEMARDVRQCLQQVAPDDPRVVVLG